MKQSRGREVPTFRSAMQRRYLPMSIKTKIVDIYCVDTVSMCGFVVSFSGSGI
jgi:hypothetical protein